MYITKKAKNFNGGQNGGFSSCGGFNNAGGVNGIAGFKVLCHLKSFPRMYVQAFRNLYF